MAKKGYNRPPIEIRSFTVEEIEFGIRKLARRKAEVEGLNPSDVRHGDPQIRNIESNIRNTVREVFGENSPEFHEHGHLTIWRGGVAFNETEHVLQRKFAEGIPQTVVILDGLIARLEEKREDLGGVVPNQDSDESIWSDIHPKIVSVVKTRFETEHYADAVESALKEVNSVVKDIVRRKTGNELDGANLMRTAFSPNNPIIVLDDLSTETGRNIQQGYMEIFAGAMIGIRNPKAHDNITITEIRAKHFIYLASLLMHKINERI
jgi:uncharacterized protein (TIGR02391 family)